MHNQTYFISVMVAIVFMNVKHWTIQILLCGNWVFHIRQFMKRLIEIRKVWHTRSLWAFSSRSCFPVSLSQTRTLWSSEPVTMRTLSEEIVRTALVSSYKQEHISKHKIRDKKRTELYSCNLKLQQFTIRKYHLVCPCNVVWSSEPRLVGSHILTYSKNKSGILDMISMNIDGVYTFSHDFPHNAKYIVGFSAIYIF
jgi:hypothetical protein